MRFCLIMTRRKKEKKDAKVDKKVEFRKGARVRLQGLTSNTECNGKTGVLKRFLTERATWMVTLDDGTRIGVKEADMLALEAGIFGEWQYGPTDQYQYRISRSGSGEILFKESFADGSFNEGVLVEEGEWLEGFLFKTISDRCDPYGQIRLRLLDNSPGIDTILSNFKRNDSSEWGPDVNACRPQAGVFRTVFVAQQEEGGPGVVLRAKPGSMQVVAKAPNGELLTIIEEQGPDVKVRWNGKEGWSTATKMVPKTVMQNISEGAGPGSKTPDDDEEASTTTAVTTTSTTTSSSIPNGNEWLRESAAASLGILAACRRVPGVRRMCARRCSAPRDEELDEGTIPPECHPPSDNV